LGLGLKGGRATLGRESRNFGRNWALKTDDSEREKGEDLKQGEPSSIDTREEKKERLDVALQEKGKNRINHKRRDRCY